MNRLVEQAVAEVRSLEERVPPGKHIVTGDIRRLSARLYRELGQKELRQVLALCEELLVQRDWALGGIAFDWAHRVRARYDEGTYAVFFGWLKEYVRGWGACDDFCTHAFGELLRAQKALFPQVCRWTEDPGFWVRRAAAVVLLPSIGRDDYQGIDPYRISDALLADPHPLVQKGYGWMLKCLSEKEPETVEQYLRRCHSAMPRTAFRYALEKFSKETRRELMAL